MRFARAVLLLGLTVTLGTGLAFLGCSDDSPTDSNRGNSNDPNFLAVQEQLTVVVDSTLQWFEDGVGSMLTLATDTTVDPIINSPTDPQAVTDSSSAVYTEDGWHVIYVSYHTDDYSTLVADSIQFVKGGEYQKSPTDLETLIYKRVVDFSAVDTTSIYESFTNRAEFTFDDLNTLEATINGTNTRNVTIKDVSGDETTWRTFSVETTISDIEIVRTGSRWDQTCPVSGTFEATVDMTYQENDGDPVTTDWGLSLTFNNGRATSIVTSNGLVWTYSNQECFVPADE